MTDEDIRQVYKSKMRKQKKEMDVTLAETIVINIVNIT